MALDHRLRDGLHPGRSRIPRRVRRDPRAAERVQQRRRYHQLVVDAGRGAVRPTPAEQRTLNALKRLTIRLGRPPKIREMASDLNKNISTVHEQLCNLRVKGFVKPIKSEEGTYNKYVLNNCCPTCGKPLT